MATEVKERIEKHMDTGPLSSPTNKGRFLDKVRQSNQAIQNGDFKHAITLYTEAINLDPINHILYSNRSAAHVKVGDYQKGLQDAVKARELNPKWAKAYYRQGVALECLGRHADALAAFASGLSQDAKSGQLLSGLIDSALKSPIKEKIQPTYQQLRQMKLDKSPFVIISVIGQELLAAGYYAAALVLLESALKIGTCSLKLRGSVFSALSSAHWALGNIDKAIACMQRDLAVCKSLGDQEGECRAHGNLGASYFSKGSYREALTNHRYQLVLGMRLKLRETAAEALSSLGHVYTALGDYPNSLASHKQCVLLVKQGGDKLWEAREIGNVGAVYLAMGEFENAVECHEEHLKIAKQIKNKVEEARAYSNLGSAYHYKRAYDAAIKHHKQVLIIAQETKDKTLEARAFAGLGHAARNQGDLTAAKDYHEKQLDNALQTHDKAAEGRACSNMGIIYHQLSECDAALKLHKAHLHIAKDINDRAGQGRAYGNIGNAYSALKQYDLAIQYHKHELAISKEVCDKHSEASTHGNLAVAYQALHVHDMAMSHYKEHLNIAQELKDTNSEARALSNLGNYHSSKGEFTHAIPYYEQYLILTQELLDTKGESKACHSLGHAHFCLGNYREACRYYEQDLALAKEHKDQPNMGKAYCNLGLAHKALGNHEQAMECQKHFLGISHTLRNLQGKFRALGNIGDVLIKIGKVEEAIKLFNQQLQIAKQTNERALEASAYGALGNAHRLTEQHDKALGFHTQELTLRQEVSDLKGECRAHSNLGNVHMAIGNYINAYKCYDEQLERGQELSDSSVVSHAYGNLGIAKMNLGLFEDAIGLFEQQLAMLEQVSGNKALTDRGHAFCNLGDCYEALGDFEEAVKCHEQNLSIVQKANNVPGQDRAYRGLGNAHRAMGNLQQALVCFEKRLYIAHELEDATAKGSAYGELGCLHSLLGNFEQAISCLEHQMNIAQEMKDRTGEGDAACGLGGVYQQMGEYDQAAEYHKKDLEIAEQTNNNASMCRAYGNLGLSYESVGDFEKAVHYQELHLNIGAKMNDRAAKTLAYSSLGRVHHALGHYSKAVQYLQQGLQIAEQLGRKEDEAKICHRLGLALWGRGDLEEAQTQLYRATELFELIRREVQISSDYKLSLFDLQTASYQALQRVLVSLNRHEEGLVVAERGRTRAFVDLLLERQSGADFSNFVDPSPMTIDQIVDVVARQKAAVLYYSIAAGYLYTWLITPEQGVVKFHECSINELDSSDPEADNQSIHSTTASLLDQYVGHVRESMGIESHTTSSIYNSRASLNRSSLGTLSETESEADDIWQQQLEEIGDKLNAENDRTGFLRLLNRNHVFNSSNYSLSSLFSLSSSTNSMSLRSARRSGSGSYSNKPPLSALYDLLIAPMDELLNSASMPKELVLVLQGDLYLVPFAVLKPSQAGDSLYERFHMIAVPSIRALQASQSQAMNSNNQECSGAVIVGNPKMTQGVRERWQWTDLPQTEHECRMVSEMLGSKALFGINATREAVLSDVASAEVIHIAAYVSWKLSSIVLSPGSASQDKPSLRIDRMADANDDSEPGIENGGPSLSDFLLTAADILNLNLKAKLVVLSSGHTDDRAGRINSDGVIGLTRAFLAAGAQGVLFSLWPVPDMASKILLKSFYTALLQGGKASHALSRAMTTVKSTKQFAHSSNWAGWLLIGSDVKLNSKVVLMGQALCELLQMPGKCREAMRVVLHLIEKSLQRIQKGQRNSMYTTAQSIENKVGAAQGWKELLISVGFRFEPANGKTPEAVFFPTTDPGDRLTQCSASLQAMLGLSATSLMALSKLLSHFEAGEMIISMLREVNTKYTQKDNNIEVPVSTKLWKIPGSHELLASLGFDLVDIGKEGVRLRTGKQASKRILQFAIQALTAVFDTQEAPRALTLDSSSSMESLTSSGTGTSTSNFSKGSSPPGSPYARKRVFNPNDVDYRMSHMKQAGFVGRGLPGQPARAGSGSSTLSLQLDHQSKIRTMVRSSSGSDTTSPTRSSSYHGLNYSDDGPRVISIDMQDSSTNDSSSSNPNLDQVGYKRQSLYERGPLKGYFPAQPTPTYSTSSPSESDEYGTEALTRMSQYRLSAMSANSSSSTLTAKSTGTGGGMRRSRSRSSIGSAKSSASDRTLTEQFDFDDNLSIWSHKSDRSAKSDRSIRSDRSARSDRSITSNRSKSSDRSQRSDKSQSSLRSKSSDRSSRSDRSQRSDRSTERQKSTRQVKFHPNTTPSVTRTDSESSVELPLKVPKSNPSSSTNPLTHPQAIAARVLAETHKQRQALEYMQHLAMEDTQATSFLPTIMSTSENESSRTTTPMPAGSLNTSLDMTRDDEIFTEVKPKHLDPQVLNTLMQKMSEQQISARRVSVSSTDESSKLPAGAHEPASTPDLVVKPIIGNGTKQRSVSLGAGESATERLGLGNSESRVSESDASKNENEGTRTRSWSGSSRSSLTSSKGSVASSRGGTGSVAQRIAAILRKDSNNQTPDKSSVDSPDVPTTQENAPLGNPTIEADSIEKTARVILNTDGAAVYESYSSPSHKATFSTFFSNHSNSSSNTPSTNPSSPLVPRAAEPSSPQTNHGHFQKTPQKLPNGRKSPYSSFSSTTTEEGDWSRRGPPPPYKPKEKPMIAPKPKQVTFKFGGSHNTTAISHSDTSSYKLSDSSFTSSQGSLTSDSEQKSPQLSYNIRYAQRKTVAKTDSNNANQMQTEQNEKQTHGYQTSQTSGFSSSQTDGSDPSQTHGYNSSRSQNQSVGLNQSQTNENEHPNSGRSATEPYYRHEVLNTASHTESQQKNGYSQSQGGNTQSQGGNTQSQGGNTQYQSGNAQSQGGNTQPQSGNTQSIPSGSQITDYPKSQASGNGHPQSTQYSRYVPTSRYSQSVPSGYMQSQTSGNNPTSQNLAFTPGNNSGYSKIPTSGYTESKPSGYNQSQPSGGQKQYPQSPKEYTTSPSGYFTSPSGYTTSSSYDQKPSGYTQQYKTYTPELAGYAPKTSTPLGNDIYDSPPSGDSSPNEPQRSDPRQQYSHLNREHFEIMQRRASINPDTTSLDTVSIDSSDQWESSQQSSLHNSYTNPHQGAVYRNELQGAVQNGSSVGNEQFGKTDGVFSAKPVNSSYDVAYNSYSFDSNQHLPNVTNNYERTSHDSTDQSNAPKMGSLVQNTMQHPPSYLEAQTRNSNKSSPRGSGIRIELRNNKNNPYAKQILTTGNSPRPVKSQNIEMAETHSPILKLKAAKPNGPLRVLYMDSNKNLSRDQVLQSSSC